MSETLLIEGELLSKESLKEDIAHLLNCFEMAGLQTEISQEILISLDIHALYHIRNSLHKRLKSGEIEKDWLFSFSNVKI